MRNMLVMFLFIFGFSALGQEYRCFIDLTSIKDDRIKVEMKLESIELNGEVEFHMPKMVPGTYSINDYGRLLSNLKVFDIVGDEIETKRLDENRWLISNGNKIDKISYWVDDSFDDEVYAGIFEPAGTNIEENNILINTFGFIGFLKGYEKLPYSIRIKHPDHLYGVSPMEREIIAENEEIFSAENYFQLSDSPIMYSLPDTASVMIDDTHVMVSVFSPTRSELAKIMMESIEPTLRAQGEYLGGDLPVKSYVILIYLHENPTNSGAMGALEHSYSTVFSYPDLDPKRLARSIVDVTSHEFFHIITPLTIHSEEIGSYNFIEPKMSKHLWLYEGVTEYSSMRVQVMYDLINTDEYLSEILKKVNGSERYNDTLAFTEMSLGALDKYKNQYGNVYAKGALIGMCLDLLLLHLSEGEYDIRQLLSELSQQYGLEKSFKDEELFDEIAQMSFPETREFFRRYVEGTEMLPLEEYLLYAGVQYSLGDTVYENTLGNISLGYDAETSLLEIVDVSKMNEFGNEMGFKEGDVLYKINGTQLSMDNYYDVMSDFYDLTSGQEIEIVVKRLTKRNKRKARSLKSTVQKLPVYLDKQIEWLPNPTQSQLKVRNAWVNKIELFNREN